ncbi:MAG: hypothetical protein LBB76_05480 [Azoarcus sp.]|jgi:hypothetical protein|nr:hypothetical protein [Azoarcus sp.]
MSSIFSRILDWLTPAPPLAPGTQAGLRRIGELVNGALPMASDFTRMLAKPVEHARAYCAGLVDALPPAIVIDRQGFASDPLIHALFASADDIGRMVASSAAVREYLAETQSWREDTFFALMAARRVEKKVLGVALQDNLIATGVPQSLLQFSNQMLILPAVDAGAARDALFAAAFDSLLRTFAEHIEQVQATYESLRTERELERARLLSRPIHERAAIPPRRISELDERLHGLFASLQPAALIPELADFLMRPETALHLDTVRLWVRRNGVIHAEGPPTGQNDAEADAEAINFMELHSRDRRRHLVLPVRVRCDEAREALEQARAQRQIRENILLI